MLDARNLCVKLGGTAVLDAITASFRPGRITAICGPNGAGKSTLLSALAGLLPNAAGSNSGGGVSLDRVSLAQLPAKARARAIGYLPQSSQVAWDVSVEALVALGRLPHGDRGAEQVSAAMAATDIAPLAKRPVSSLSGGEKARALLARVLAGEPRFILADEPLAALDLRHQLAILAQLRDAAEKGAGVVLVLHDLPLAMNHADEVLVLKGGRAHKKGPPEAALSAEVIQQVWSVPARWLGEPGAQALSIS